MRCGDGLWTHERSLDAVEEQNLNHHNGRRDGIEVEDDKRLEPALTE
jgi:hypothetical protein